MECLELAIPPLPQLLTVGHSIWKPGQQHLSRSFNVYDLLFVVRGTLYLSEEEVPYEVTEGSFLVLEPNRRHAGTRPCDADTEIYWLHLVHPAPVRTLDSGQIPWSMPFTKSTNQDESPHTQFMYIPKFTRLPLPEVLPYLQRMQELHHGLTLAASLPLQAELAGLLAVLQSAVRSQYAPRSRLLCDQIIAYLQTNLNRPFDAKHMERSLHFHFDYLARCLKACTGLSPLQYRHELQIKKAKSLLEQTGLSVSEVGFRVGLENPNYFIRLFRRSTGMTPGQYRNGRLDRA